MTNAEVAKIFSELADMLEMKGENQFKVRAYREAARTIKHLPWEVERMVGEGQNLEEIPGVGEAIAKKIAEIVNTGHLGIHDKLREEFPQGILELLSVPGIGPKIAMRLYKEAGVTNVDELEAAIKDGRVARMPRMGDKAAQRMVKQIESMRSGERAC